MENNKIAVPNSDSILQYLILSENTYVYQQLQKNHIGG
jgi:hypothetical protein